MTFVSEYVTQSVRINDIRADQALPAQSRVTSGFPFWSLCPSESGIQSHFFEVPIIKVGSCADKRVRSGRRLRFGKEHGHRHAKESGQHLQVGNRRFVGGGFPARYSVGRGFRCTRQVLLANPFPFQSSPQLPNLAADLVVDISHNVFSVVLYKDIIILFVLTWRLICDISLYRIMASLMRIRKYGGSASAFARPGTADPATD
jgi:hypothetical protein